jgi:sulfur-carrier protein
MNKKMIQDINQAGMEALKSGKMQINVIVFGQLSEITGTDHLQIDNVNDTDQLEIKLKSTYPLLCDTKYLVAVEKQMITGNTPLKNNCTVALLPPFSGG